MGPCIERPREPEARFERITPKTFWQADWGRWQPWILEKCRGYASDARRVLEVGGVGKELGPFLDESRIFTTLNWPQEDICRRTRHGAGSFDLVLCKHTLEHVHQPFGAASEMVRLLAPGGVLIVITHWAWRYHTAPPDVEDYWRFSVPALRLLFSGLAELEAAYDQTERRKNVCLDAVPEDELGGWRENWHVFFIGRKASS